MLNILLLILQFLVLIILLVTIISFILWSIGNFTNRVPFVTCSLSVLENIKDAFSIKDDSVVYDLGCGDGRVLFHLSHFNKNAKYIGIENSSFPFLLSKIGAFLNKKKHNVNIEILKKDFFKQDLTNATNIFVYLYPTIMDELLPKFEKELKPGTELVSLSFKFKDKKPIREIDLNRNKYKLGRKLFVYQF
jgi:SAM-dependent methyltransferase